MTDHELLLSLHQKVECNHKWVKRQVGEIVKDLNATRNAVKKNNYYLHEIFDHTWAILSHLKTPEELTEMEFQQDFDWSWPPKKKFKKILVPQLVASSFSSTRITNEAEGIDNTAAMTDPNAPLQHKSEFLQGR
ncbi:hypothetical protein ZWY2020_051968 [Hordeum vulgare]|nr:hypothetical protein ZWY2020_051968 [Hordeum vulgare]